VSNRKLNDTVVVTFDVMMKNERFEDACDFVMKFLASRLIQR